MLNIMQIEFYDDFNTAAAWRKKVRHSTYLANFDFCLIKQHTSQIGADLLHSKKTPKDKKLRYPIVFNDFLKITTGIFILLLTINLKSIFWRTTFNSQLYPQLSWITRPDSSGARV